MLQDIRYRFMLLGVYYTLHPSIQQLIAPNARRKDRLNLLARPLHIRVNANPAMTAIPIALHVPGALLSAPFK